MSVGEPHSAFGQRIQLRGRDLALRIIGAEVAEPLVEEVVAELRRRDISVATGVFGADMSVSLVNDGPVRLIVEV